MGAGTCQGNRLGIPLFSLARSRYFALVFCGDTGLERGAKPNRDLSPTRSVWRFPRPPNLDSQYRTRRSWCQEKIAKSGEEFSKASISSGGLSGEAGLDFRQLP